MAAAPILTILRNGETIKAQPIEGEVLLGRGEGCVIRLEDRAVSRQHAAFRQVSNGVQVEKRNEFAPLLVNGVECSTAVLKEGDVISIGPYLLRLNIPKEVAPPAPIDESGQTGLPGAPGSENALDAPPAVLDVSADVPANSEGTAISDLPEGEFGNAVPVEQPGNSEGLVPPNEAAQGTQDPAAGGILSLQESSAMISDDGKTRVASSTNLIAKLIFPTSSANVTEFDIKADEISIGRGKNCDIVLNDRKSSRKHATIRREGARFTFRDLQSANGTFVNDIKIQEHELAGDDILRIGDVEFQFVVVSGDYVEQQKDFMPIPPPEPELAAAYQPMSPELQGLLPGQEMAMQGDVLAPQAPGGDLDGIPGITGIPGLGSGKKQTLVEKFKALPKRKQYIYGGVAAAFLLFMLVGDPVAPKKKKANAKAGATASTGQAAPATFESLSADQKKFIETQHDLAFDLYRNHDYDKALFEVRKIFPIIPDFKDSREIERYAIEGKRKLEAIEEEKRKKDEEARIKAEVVKLVEQTEAIMAQKQYEQAKEYFGQILALDPENSRVGAWRREIEEFEDQKRIEEQQRQVRDEVNKRAWEILTEGMALRKQGKCHSAIDVFAKVKEIGAEDAAPAAKARKYSLACIRSIARARDPVLAEAKEAEDAGDYAKAYQFYKKATQVDPPHPAGYAGIERVRTVLHDRAKDTYTEAILAESYSDFTKAKSKYQECLLIAPEDDIYYERAKHKLAKYFPKGEPKVE